MASGTFLEKNYEVTRRDLTKEKTLKYGAGIIPFLTSIVPALIFAIIAVLSGSPPAAAFFFFAAFVSLIAGFIIGLIISGLMIYYRKKWLNNMRERIAVDGIKTEEVAWFQHELSTAEKLALKEIEAKDRLLADAYRETLASRLTATRIIKNTKKELLLVQKRQNKLKYIKSEVSGELISQLNTDHKKLSEINGEAISMENEAKARLEMIEAASRRGGNFADSQLALKKLSARAAELPLALEALKMEEEIRKEIESEEEKLLSN